MASGVPSAVVVVIGGADTLAFIEKILRQRE
jgi:hypothetical protein